MPRSFEGDLSAAGLRFGVIASRDTYDLIVERGEADMKSEIERFPRLFRAVETIPGLTWPTVTFRGRMTQLVRRIRVTM